MIVKTGSDPTVGVVIPTFQAVHHLPHCLPPLLRSPLKPRRCILDSSSTDGTVELARAMGAQVVVIPQREFNHGTTREKGRQIVGTSIVVMVTQDAYATSPEMLERLVQPIVEKRASIAYARQLPHKGVGFLGAFARRFNYPPRSHIRGIEDAATYGAYTFFCSNSCAAYCNQALDEIGGFSPVLFGEDTLVVSQLLHKLHRIAYVAEAEVYHSHEYPLKQEFFRHFDMGLARREYHHWLAIAGSDQERGKRYVKTLLRELWDTSPSSIPYALCQTLVKFCGYRLGRASLHAPLWMKKRLSSQPAYWESQK